MNIVNSFFRRHSAATSESRMQRMMICCGIDEVTARYADHLLHIDMNAVRHRCRHCSATDLCDHWLNGEAVAGNGFCPNMLIFRVAAARRARVNS